MNYNNNLMFLESALTVSGCNQSIDDVIEWIKHQNEKIYLSIKKVPFSYLKEWEFSEKNRNLRHKTGKFFSIDGIEVKTNWNGFTSWSQPIINQPEVGYLGFITKEFKGVLHFLGAGLFYWFSLGFCWFSLVFLVFVWFFVGFACFGISPYSEMAWNAFEFPRHVLEFLSVSILGTGRPTGPINP